MNRRLALPGLIGAAAGLHLLPAAAQAPGGDMEQRQRTLAASALSTATSQLAVSRGTAATVRSFANFEIAEQAALLSAMRLAALPTPPSVQLDAEHTQTLRQLERLSGPAFDRAYIEGQLAGHRELLALHQRMASSGARDERIISTVAVAGIEQHIALLQGMQGQA